MPENVATKILKFPNAGDTQDASAIRPAYQKEAWISFAEACHKTGRSLPTLYRWSSQGKIRVAHAGKYCVDAASLDHYRIDGIWYDQKARKSHG
jgi:hypothetical protein